MSRKRRRPLSRAELLAAARTDYIRTVRAAARWERRLVKIAQFIAKVIATLIGWSSTVQDFEHRLEQANRRLEARDEPDDHQNL